jgi:hypothetical protein
MYRSMAAYQEGMGTQDAQLKVKTFSSKLYKSHKRVLKTIAKILMSECSVDTIFSSLVSLLIT